MNGTRKAWLFMAVCLLQSSVVFAAAPAKRPGMAAAPSAPSGSQAKGYLLRPAPAWVKDPYLGKPAPNAITLPAGGKAMRELLADVQIQVADTTRTSYFRSRRVALDASTLREVSEPTIQFNPTYQRLVIHDVSIERNGQRLDKLKDARIDIIRREQQLEQQVLDGLNTALLMLRDVRVGDVVDMAYTIEGTNPIFEGHFAEILPTAWDAHIDQLHVRVETPMDRPLRFKNIQGQDRVEQFQEDGKQVLRIVRQQVPGQAFENGTPPWYKFYPAVQVTDYKDWSEVDLWARKLFAIEPAKGELLSRIQAWQSSTQDREALLAEVLRFVQDDIRYFSVSLGESSHRPKPADQTLKDRMGDCKDKVLLLNTLLTGLGFEARPALVSVSRNRGLLQYLPTHDQFDHVISQVRLGDQVHYLDATINGQGMTLKNRGYYDLGAALIVGDGASLTTIGTPAFAMDRLSFQQNWQMTSFNKPAKLDVRIQAQGLTAERWRASLTNQGMDRMVEAIGGNYLRVLPGLITIAPAELHDSRHDNLFQLTLHFEHPNLGEYRRGSLELDLTPFEMAEFLSSPQEARRKSPVLLALPNLVESRVSIMVPRAVQFNAPPAQVLQGKHIAFHSKMEIRGQEVTGISRLERKRDEVLPTELEAFREQIIKTRQYARQSLRLPLLERPAVMQTIKEVEERSRAYAERKPDMLLRLIQEQDLIRALADQSLAEVDPKSVRAREILVDSAMASNLLGDFKRGQQDSERALAINPDDSAALEVKGVALVGQQQLEAGMQALDRARQLGRAGSGSWLGIVQYTAGQTDLAAQTLQSQLADAAGEEQTFGLAWLYLAREKQKPGQGLTAIESYLPNTDADKWPGAILHHLAGHLSRDDLLKVAQAEPEQTRLRMAEASFFIAHMQLLKGDQADAIKWLERTVATRAVPYREVTLAQVTLARLKATP